MSQSKEIIDKNFAVRIMAIKGQIRGLGLKHDLEYILKMWGEEGLKEVERELERLGYPLRYREIKEMDFFPIGTGILVLTIVKNFFDVPEEKIADVCAFHPKTPLVAKLFMKYFYSIPKIMERTQKMWREYWTIGEIDFKEYNENDKYAILQVRDFDLDPLVCRCLDGYFRSMAESVLGKGNITVKETKCSFKGERIHEFIIKW
jgi:hypothetical protein